MWRPVVARLCARYRCVAIDQRGFGDSSLPESPYSDCDDVAAVCEALGLHRPVLVGNSLGGSTVLDAAVAKPELPAAIALFAAFAGGWTYGPEMSEFAARMARIRAERGEQAAFEADVDFWLLHGRDASVVSAEIRDYVHAARARTRDRKPNQSLRRIGPTLERLDRVAVPAEIVTGDADVGDFAAIARLLHDGIAGSTLRTLPAGHFIPLERPGDAAEIVDALARRVFDCA